MRPGNSEPSVAYRFADVEFHAPLGPLRVGGQAVTLEPRPLRLLAELLARCNEVVTKEELFDTVWAGRFTVDHVLANAVSKLRVALGDEGAARLQTVPRVGYRFMGPVQRSSANALAGALSAGQRVPGRENFVLEAPLGAGGISGISNVINVSNVSDVSNVSNVWRARHAKLGYLRVFKFANDAARLAALKREYTLYRVLRQELGPRDDFAVIVDAQFARAPYWLECEWGGQALSEWAQDGNNMAAVPRQQRLATFIALTRAVDAAHGVSVLHKDIKPANVLVDGAPGGWRWRLTDFGAGRLLDADRLAALQLTALGLTQAADAVSDSRSGTLAYLAPEVVVGGLHSAQADVYALGVLLYQWLAGDVRRPMATGWQQDIDDPELCDDIQRATEGRPEKRLASAGALADRLVRLDERRAQRMRAQAQHDRERAAAEQEMRRALGDASAQTERADALQTFLNDDLMQVLGIGQVGAGSTLPVREVLQQMAARGADRFAGAPLLHAEFDIALGRTFYRLGWFDDAHRRYDSALALCAGAGPTAQALRLATRSRLKLAVLHTDRSRYDEAERLLAAAGDAAADPTDPADLLARDFAQARMKLAMARRRHDEAVALGERLCALAEGAPLRDAEAVFSSRYMLAHALCCAGRCPESEAHWRALLALGPAAAGVGEVQHARAHTGLGRALFAQGGPERLAEAARLFAHSCNALQRLLGPDDPGVAAAYGELGAVHQAAAEWTEAAAAFAAAHAAYLSRVGAGAEVTRVARLNLAISRIDLGEPEAAQPVLDDERGWFALHHGEDGAFVQCIDFERARVCNALGQGDRALKILRTLDPTRLHDASQGTDWQARLDAERARALAGGGGLPPAQRHPQGDSTKH